MKIGQAVDGQGARAGSRRVMVTCCLFAAGVFAMITSESMAAGLLPTIAVSAHVSVGSAAALIFVFAAGQVVGAWGVGVPLSRFPPRITLTAFLIVFAAVQAVGLIAPWPVQLAMRFVLGALMTAYFATALGTAARLTSGAAQARATAIVFLGGTLGTTLGLPLATYFGTTLIGWRGAFFWDSVVALLAAAALALLMPSTPGERTMTLREVVRPLANGRLWWTYLTAALTIAAALLAFSFFSTILEQVTHIGPAMTPWILALYGLASVVGTLVVGKITSTRPTRVVAVGLLLLIVGLLGFWMAPTVAPAAIGGIVAVGLSGVSLNAAQTARNVQAAGAGPAVMAMAPTIVTAGIFIGTAVGAAAVDSPLGILSPLWIGAFFGLLGLATLLPDARSALHRRKSS